MHGAGQDRQAEEHDAEQRAHHTPGCVRAFFHAGSWKAGTPLEMASTPVTAAPPEAKARSTTNSAAPMNSPSPGVPILTSPVLVQRLGVGRWPMASRTTPDDQQHDHVDEEEVGRDGEDLARLLHAAQVAEGDDERRSTTEIGTTHGASAGTAEARAARARRPPTRRRSGCSR